MRSQRFSSVSLRYFTIDWVFPEMLTAPTSTPGTTHFKVSRNAPPPSPPPSPHAAVGSFTHSSGLARLPWQVSCSPRIPRGDKEEEEGGSGAAEGAGPEQKGGRAAFQTRSPPPPAPPLLVEPRRAERPSLAVQGQSSASDNEASVPPDTL